ncbi:hypothetical protein [Duganella vulcania]|uniref:Uncharacterized protein n=1 Tax=Duganella vulcania TaxID=2692166 RepID=A0A845GH73_9BURK|nr:hypothetical protein [Duganella vulcania]MYM92358.1 hypothetical protein [Duganella vulcania]
MNEAIQYMSLLGNKVHHEHATAGSLRRKAIAAAHSGRQQNAAILKDKAAKHDQRMKQFCARLRQPMWMAGQQP